MVRDRQEVKRRLQPHPGPVIGMSHRFPLGEAISRVGIGRPVAEQVGVIGQVGVQVGVAPEQLVGEIVRHNRRSGGDE